MYKFKKSFKGNFRQEEYGIIVPNNFVATNVIKLYTEYGYLLSDVYYTDKKVKSIKVDSASKELGILYEGQDAEYKIEYYFADVVDYTEEELELYKNATVKQLKTDVKANIKTNVKAVLPVIHPSQLEERIKSSIERFIIDECTNIDISVNENTSKLSANLELDTDKLSAYVKGIESVLKCLQ